MNSGSLACMFGAGGLLIYEGQMPILLPYEYYKST
jgi:hypothetical protein